MLHFLFPSLSVKKRPKITSLIATGSLSTLCVHMKDKVSVLSVTFLLQSQRVKFKLVLQDTLLRI